jgi:murein peptide amidase A
MNILNYVLILFLFLSCESRLPEKTHSAGSISLDSKSNKKQNKKTETILLSLNKSEEVKNIGEQEQKYCRKIDKKFYQYGWRNSRCDKYRWVWVRRSFWGNIIPWVVAGEPEEVEANTTIVFCGVHGDEITPVKFCFDIMNYVRGLGEKLRGHRVVIAPLVSPDSFLKKYPTRTNARGVDANRNFPTNDWNKDALRLWRTRYRSSKRRYPGKKSKSEQETYFQINLINRYRPQKIISVHAPLTIIDYDGPESTKDDKEHVGKSLLVQMSKKANGYKVKNYPFFPGSLGNWAGNERGIPTYTLELPTSDNRLHKKYWKKFKPAILYAITHNFKVPEVVKE